MQVHDAAGVRYEVARFPPRSKLQRTPPPRRAGPTSIDSKYPPPTLFFPPYSPQKQPCQSLHLLPSHSLHSIASHLVLGLTTSTNIICNFIPHPSELLLPQPPQSQCNTALSLSSPLWPLPQLRLLQDVRPPSQAPSKLLQPTSRARRSVT